MNNNNDRFVEEFGQRRFFFLINQLKARLLERGVSVSDKVGLYVNWDYSATVCSVSNS